MDRPLPRGRPVLFGAETGHAGIRAGHDCRDSSGFIPRKGLIGHFGRCFGRVAACCRRESPPIPDFPGDLGDAGLTTRGAPSRFRSLSLQVVELHGPLATKPLIGRAFWSDLDTGAGKQNTRNGARFRAAKPGILCKWTQDPLRVSCLQARAAYIGHGPGAARRLFVWTDRIEQANAHRQPTHPQAAQAAGEA